MEEFCFDPRGDVLVLRFIRNSEGALRCRVTEAATGRTWVFEDAGLLCEVVARVFLSKSWESAEESVKDAEETPVYSGR